MMEERLLRSSSAFWLFDGTDWDMLLMEVGSNDGSVNLFPQFPQNMASSGALFPQYLQNSMFALLSCDRLQAIHPGLLDSIENEVACNESTSGIECDTYSSLFVCRIVLGRETIVVRECY